jgi:hypothetical protein
MKKIRSIATIVRPQNAMEKWLQGDPTICSFSRALDDWAGDVAQGKPLCLTCEHEFQMGNLPPAFMLVEVDVQENSRPDQLILTGICDDCAIRGDDELLHRGADLLKEAWPKAFPEGVIT